MNDKIALITSGVILIAFFICGLVGILENYMVMLLIIGSFTALIIYIIIEFIKNHKKEP